MAEGTVKTLTDRGFGFITPDDGQGRGDIFFHRSAVEGTDFEQLRTGDRVRYDTEDDPRGKGLRAAHVRLQAD